MDLRRCCDVRVGLFMDVRLVDGDPCGVLDDLLAGSYDPDDPLQMAAAAGTNSAEGTRPRVRTALVLVLCLSMLAVGFLDGQ